MRAFLKRCAAFRHDEDGPTATEYGIMLGLLLIPIMVVAGEFNDHVNNMYNIIIAACTSEGL